MSLLNELFTVLKKGYVFKLFLWNYFTAHWKEYFLCNFKLADEFINKSISAKLKNLNEQSIIIDSLLSNVLKLNKYNILSAAQKILFNWMSDRHLCTEEPSENLLKKARAECVWIIIFSFNSNRKFLMNKNTYLNMSEAVEIDEHQLNSFTSVMKILIPFSASVFKSDEFDYLLH